MSKNKREAGEDKLAHRRTKIINIGPSPALH